MSEDAMVEIPSLHELQVLSPIAWIQREKERIGTGKFNLASYASMPRGSKVFVAVIEENLPETRVSIMPDDCRRRLEWALIHLATHAVLWLESMRSETPFELEMVNKDGSED